jgi:hypothetical protein
MLTASCQPGDPSRSQGPWHVSSMHMLCCAVLSLAMSCCAVLWCHPAGFADRSRAAVCGGSHGGFLSGHLMGQHPDRFKCAGLRNPVLNIALMVGVTDIPDWCFVETYGTEVRGAGESMGGDGAHFHCSLAQGGAVGVACMVGAWACTHVFVPFWGVGMHPPWHNVSRTWHFAFLPYIGLCCMSCRRAASASVLSLAQMTWPTSGTSPLWPTCPRFRAL